MIELLLEGIVLLATAGMFWYPNSGSDFHPEPYKPESWKEKYLRKLNSLYIDGNYTRLVRALSKPKLPPEEMPTRLWKANLPEKKERLEKKLEQLFGLYALEKMLK